MAAAFRTAAAPNTCATAAGRRGLRISSLLLHVSLFVAACALLLQTTAAKNLDTLVGEAGQHHYNYQQHHHHQQQAEPQHHHQQRQRLQRRDSSDKNWIALEQCGAVRGYFESIDIKLDGIYEQKGAICGSDCCSNSTEAALRQKATTDFERLLHHHTKSLRDMLESTSNMFQNHVLELTEQSENKTLHVFSQVYRRMVPLSRELIRQLYAEIISHLKNTGSPNLNSLESAIQKFFVNLFPVAYHQAVHLNKDNNGDLHEDYINCLKHTYDDLQPFGGIPKDIKQHLLQSVQTAQIFMNSLLQSAEVLSETDMLYDESLSDTCKKHLLKMNYCPSCTGLQKSQVKVCYGYCMNVLRGCSAQYAGVLDGPWSNVVDAIDNLVTTHIHADSGIVTVIKQLDAKLSETIMRAMEKGPELEKKVTKTCGTPKLLPSLTEEMELRPQAQHSIKWATPADAEILHFLSTIEKSKEFYANIVNNVCEDEDIQRNDHHCWTGDRIGQYSQLTVSTVTQRYNPEVPLEKPQPQTSKLDELVNKLIQIRMNIGSAMPSTAHAYSDVQSDMARHDEEGSGRINDDVDDEEYGMHGGSGDGSGDGEVTPNIDRGADTTDITHNSLEPRNAATSTTAPAARWCYLGALAASTLVTLLLTGSSRYAHTL